MVSSTTTKTFHYFYRCRFFFFEGEVKKNYWLLNDFGLNIFVVVALRCSQNFEFFRKVFPHLECPSRIQIMRNCRKKRQGSTHVLWVLESFLSQISWWFCSKRGFLAVYSFRCMICKKVQIFDFFRNFWKSSKLFISSKSSRNFATKMCVFWSKKFCLPLSKRLRLQEPHNFDESLEQILEQIPGGFQADEAGLRWTAAGRRLSAWVKSKLISKLAPKLICGFSVMLPGFPGRKST